MYKDVLLGVKRFIKWFVFLEINEYIDIFYDFDYLILNVFVFFIVVINFLNSILDVV